MVRIKSKIEELYTLDSPNSGTPLKIRAIRPKPISPDTVEKLISGITSTRDKALVMLFANTGLRAGEVVRLDQDSITYVNRALPDGSAGISGVGRVFGTKSHGGREFYLSPRTVAALAEYLADRADDGLPALFVNKDGRLTTLAILRTMHRWCDLIGIERIGPRQLRHYFAWGFMFRGGYGHDLCRLLGVVDPSGMKNFSTPSAFPVGLPA